MALLATGWETSGRMVRVGSALVVRCVTGVTLRGEPLKLARGRTFVAGFAVNS